MYTFFTHIYTSVSGPGHISVVQAFYMMGHFMELFDFNYRRQTLRKTKKNVLVSIGRLSLFKGKFVLKNQ